MVNVLQGRPEKAEPAKHGEVAENWNVEEVNHGAMQKKNDQCFEPDAPKIFWIKRFLERRRGAIQVCGLRQPNRIQKSDEVADDNHQPKEPGKNSVKLQVFPNRALTLKI